LGPSLYAAQPLGDLSRLYHRVLQNLYSFLAALNWGTPDKQTMGSFGPVTISNISTSSLDARLARVDNRMARMESVTNACWKEVSRMEALFRADLLSIKESAVRLEASVAQIIRAVAKFTVGITTNNDNRTINNVTPGVTPKPDLDPDMYRNLVAILKEHTRTLLEAREVGQKVLVTTSKCLHAAVLHAGHAQSQGRVAIVFVEAAGCLGQAFWAIHKQGLEETGS
jgi:hypothetical protein